MSLRRSLLGACIAALTIAAPAQAEIINTTFDAPMDGDAAFVNCVTGESVPYVQTYHIVANVYTDENGDQQVDLRRFDPLTATAIGPVSGDRYLLQTKSVSTGDPLDGTKPATSVVSFHVIDTGSGADFEFGGTFHTTVNANGELTVAHETGSFRCGHDHLHVGVQL